MPRGFLPVRFSGSPHARGWTESDAAKLALEAGFPARAAMVDADDDDLMEALDDAVSDGEGWLVVEHVRHHLAKRGLRIVRIGEGGT